MKCYLGNSRMDANQIVKVGFRGAQFQCDGEALSYLASVGGEDVQPDNFFLRNEKERYKKSSTKIDVSLHSVI